MRGWQVEDAVKGGDVNIGGAKVYVVVYGCVVLLCAGRGGGGSIGCVCGNMLVEQGRAFV